MRSEIGTLLRGLLVAKSQERQNLEGLAQHSLFCGLSDETDVRSTYEFGAPIGQGGFGVVNEVTHKATGVKYACKSVLKSRLQDPQAMQLFRHEAEIHMHLSGHPYVVSIVDCFEDDSSVYLVEELCSGGTLLDHIMKHGRYNEHESARLFRNIIDFLFYCHRMGVCHRDVKLENFLFTSSAPDATLKATDFGLSCFMSGVESRSDVVGTVHYTAPEVFQGSYNFTADLWSAGIILYAMLSGLLPFSHNDPVVLAKYVMRAPIELEAGPWTSVSKLAKDCIKCLLDRNPFTRATAQIILLHPWLKHEGYALEQPLDKPMLRRFTEFAVLSMFKKKLYNALVMQLPDSYVSGLKTLYESIDMDKDGVLTKADVKKFSDHVKLAAALQAENTTENVTNSVGLFEQLDIEGKGAISFQNFLAGVINRKVFHNSAMAKIAFGILDKSNLGYLNRDHLAHFIGTDSNSAAVDEIMRAADSDLNGLIDLREFTAYWLDRPLTETISTGVVMEGPGINTADYNYFRPDADAPAVVDDKDFGDKLKKALVNNFVRMPNKVLDFLEPTSLLNRLGIGDSKKEKKLEKEKKDRRKSDTY